MRVDPFFLAEDLWPDEAAVRETVGCGSPVCQLFLWGEGEMCAGLIPQHGGQFAQMVLCKMVLLFWVRGTGAKGDPWAGAAPSSHLSQDGVPAAPRNVVPSSWEFSAWLEL